MRADRRAVTPESLTAYDVAGRAAVPSLFQQMRDATRSWSRVGDRSAGAAYDPVAINTDLDPGHPQLPDLGCTDEFRVDP
jgi:hypothetical protein